MKYLRVSALILYQMVLVTINLDCQLHGIQNYHGNRPLAVSVRNSLDQINAGGIILRTGDKNKTVEFNVFCFLTVDEFHQVSHIYVAMVSLTVGECSQLSHVPAAMVSLTVDECSQLSQDPAAMDSLPQ